MSDCCNDEQAELEFLKAQLVLVEAAITATITAITAVTTGGLASYSFDTGQTRQTVTKSNLGSIRMQLDNLYSLRGWLKSQICGTGSYYVRPGF